MAECNIYSNLSAVPLNDQTQFRLNKINEIKDYFAAEIKERELMTKRLNLNLVQVLILHFRFLQES